MYAPRFYREEMKAEGLVFFSSIYKQTDVLIASKYDQKNKADEIIAAEHLRLENYILQNPEFLSSHLPLELSPPCPKIARIMAAAASKCGVGPMAAVAGAFNFMLAEGLTDGKRELIIENGGDIYMASEKDRTISLYAGENKFKDNIRVKIKSTSTPIGICTSSGKFGHSFSYGKADAVTIFAADPVLSDAAATATANKIKTPDDIASAIAFAQGIEGVSGVIAICDDKIGLWGEVELT